MFMTGKNLSAAVLTACTFIVCAAAAGDDKFDPVSMETSRIAAVIKPYAKNTVSVEKLEDKSILTGPAFAWRLVFSRNYKKQTPQLIGGGNPVPGPEAIASDRSFVDHADVVIVDREAGVKIDEMLKQDKIEAVGTDGMFFKKYGLTWRNLTGNEYTNFVVYLGYDEKYYFFCSGNISVIATLKKRLFLEGGENMLPVLASALNARDFNDFSATIAMRELKNAGPDCIPYVRKSAEDCLAVDNRPVTQILTLFSLKDLEGDKALNDFAEAKDENLLGALFDTLILNRPYRKSLLNVYVSMLLHHVYITEAGLAIYELGEKDTAKKEMENVAARPRSVHEYISAKKLIFIFSNENILSSHSYLSDQIKLFAIRNGEVPDSIKYLNVNESEVEREIRLSKTDRERLEPFEKALIEQPYPEFTLLYALDLAFFNTKAKRVDPEYIKRVRRSGRNVLAGLPFEMVDPAIKTLIKYSEFPDEKADLEALYTEIKKRSL